MKTQILAQVPGVFYDRAAPDKPPFKAPGDAVAVDDVIAVVEIMKSFMEVKAEAGGTNFTYLVENGDTVDVEQPIAEFDAN